jgi:hypothetical protein
MATDDGKSQREGEASREESRGEASQHDRAYRAMFEHVVLLEALVEEYGPPGWAEGLDFEKAHQLQGKFGLPDFEQRESDMLWSVPRKDGSAGAYVVLMLEFQSSNDRWMAVRLLMYAALMWQRTIHEASLGARDKLPPVLGLVTYRGEGRWTAPLSLGELIDLPAEDALRAWQPQMRYHLIDERREVARRPPEEDRLAGLLFRLEHDGDDNHFLKALGKAVALLHGTPHADLLLQIFARLQQTSKLKDVADEPRLLALQEDRPMLDLIQKNFERILDNREQKGEARGKLEGRLEGKLEGEAQERAKSVAAQRRALVKYLNRCFGAEHGWEQPVSLVEDLDALQALFDLADEAQDAEQMRQRLEGFAVPGPK